MKLVGIIISVVVGALGLIYDLWLIHSGYLDARAILALVAWMALLLLVCARLQGGERDGEPAANKHHADRRSASGLRIGAAWPCSPGARHSRERPGQRPANSS